MIIQITEAQSYWFYLNQYDQFTRRALVCLTHLRSSITAMSCLTWWNSLAILQCSLYTSALSLRDPQGGTGFKRLERDMWRRRDVGLVQGRGRKTKQKRLEYIQTWTCYLQQHFPGRPMHFSTDITSGETRDCRMWGQQLRPELTCLHTAFITPAKCFFVHTTEGLTGWDNGSMSDGG